MSRKTTQIIQAAGDAPWGVAVQPAKGRGIHHA